jgi:hypothetical protein
MARIVRNYSTFGKRNDSRLTLSSSTNALGFLSARTTKTLAIVAVRIRNKDCSPVGINR